MSEPGLASIIIPVYNRSAMLVDAVNSALAQDYRPIEIIIVDDGSSDNTLATAKQLSSNNEEVSVLSIENSGPGLAREQGRQKAAGEFIQYLDSDDLLHRSKLALQIEQLNSQPECGVSYCIQEYCTFDGKVLDEKWMRSGEHFEFMFPTMLSGRIWGTPVPLYRSSLLQQAGPWLDLKNQEDWEYDCRVASFGVRLNYLAKTLVTIRTHETEHFGQIGANDDAKLVDRSRAYQLIFEHAVSAKIKLEHYDFLSFNRSVFLLARQCARRGLAGETKVLMRLALASTNNAKRKFEYRVYTLLSNIFGWSRMGKLSSALDKVRA